MRPDIVPGAVFPDYQLSDHTSKRRKLSELQEQDPMILILSRGGFCPKERRQAEGLLALHREMEVGFCRLVTISTDNLLETNEYRSGVGAQPSDSKAMVLELSSVIAEDGFQPLGLWPSQKINSKITLSQLYGVIRLDDRLPIYPGH